jgi:hypothetical protein
MRKCFYQKAHKHQQTQQHYKLNQFLILFFHHILASYVHLQCSLVKISVKTLNGQWNLCFSWHILMIKEFVYLLLQTWLKKIATFNFFFRYLRETKFIKKKEKNRTITECNKVAAFLCKSSHLQR